MQKTELHHSQREKKATRKMKQEAEADRGHPPEQLAGTTGAPQL